MSNEGDANVNDYQAGSTVLLTQEYLDQEGAPTNPTTVVLRTRDPDGLVATPAVENPEVGTYTSAFVVGVAGRWVYEWRTTGGDSVSVGEFGVMPSPIEDPLTGLVARAVRSMIPTTWDALARADYYGTSLLNERIRVAKEIALGPVLADSDESTLTALMREYLATLAAIEIIPAGIEYWMNQKIAVSTTGTNETTSFTDRQLALLKSLLPQLRAKAASLATNPGIVSSLVLPGEAPMVSGNDCGVLVTEDPYDFPIAFRDAIRR